MISKNKIKLIKSLQIKKYRQKNNKTFLEGKRLIEESINGNINIETIWHTEEFAINSNNAKFINKIQKLNLSIDTITKEDLKVVSDTRNSQGIIAEINLQFYNNTSISNLDNNIVILNSISDPGNLGTILRTCAWFGIKSIILTSDTTDPYNSKCLRSGVGAHFYFKNLVQLDNAKIFSLIKDNNYTAYCADLDGDDISNVSINDKWALIFGSEAHGLDEDFNKFNKITIHKVGEIESLNVSVACGIILNNFIN